MTRNYLFSHTCHCEQAMQSRKIQSIIVGADPRVCPVLGRAQGPAPTVKQRNDNLQQMNLFQRKAVL
jgi:hypothetical protein